MDSLCVNDLSAVDTSISGTLSVNDAIIQDATITNLSATDAIIQDATITLLSATDAVIQDLTVINCMDSLCVNDLSAVDASISGTLSVNDAIIENVTIDTLSAIDVIVGALDVTCDLSVGCNISMVDSTDAAHGNIIKNGS